MWLLLTLLVGCAPVPSSSPPRAPRPLGRPVATTTEPVAAEPGDATEPAELVVASEIVAAEPVHAAAPVEPAVASELVRVRAGVVGIGCPPARHATCLGRRVRAFAIQRTLVTPGQYAECVRAGACAPPVAPGVELASGAVAGISVTQAEAYCAYRELRLPSEAEWERARETGAIRPVDGDPTEYLLGWYTFFGDGFRGDDIGVAGIGNTRLIIRMLGGLSYRYGVGEPVEPAVLRRQDDPLSFRCVRGPTPDEPIVRCRWDRGVVCGERW